MFVKVIFVLYHSIFYWPPYTINYDYIATVAAKDGHMDILLMCQPRGASLYNVMNVTAMNGQEKIVDWCINLGGTPIEQTLIAAAKGECRHREKNKNETIRSSQ